MSAAKSCPDPSCDFFERKVIPSTAQNCPLCGIALDANMAAPPKRNVPEVPQPIDQSAYPHPQDPVDRPYSPPPSPQFSPTPINSIPTPYSEQQIPRTVFSPAVSQSSSVNEVESIPQLYTDLAAPTQPAPSHFQESQDDSRLAEFQRDEPVTSPEPDNIPTGSERPPSLKLLHLASQREFWFPAHLISEGGYIGRRSLSGGISPAIDLSELHDRDIEVVSRCHAQIKWDEFERAYKITDESTNGTFLNGTQLVKGRSYMIKTGDRLQLGQQEPGREVVHLEIEEIHYR